MSSLVTLSTNSYFSISEISFKLASVNPSHPNVNEEQINNEEDLIQNNLWILF